MLADELANHIKTLGIVPADWPVQVSNLDAGEPHGVIVMPPLDGMVSIPEFGRYFRGNMQVVVRDDDPPRGDNIATQLMDALHTVAVPIALPHYSIRTMVSRGLPIPYPKNDAGLFEFSVNFDTTVIRL